MQQLTKREIHVLLYLLETTEPVTTKELAEMQQVSVRTIKYDLDDIRNWLGERKQVLESKRSRGIWLEVNDSERLKLKSELLEVDRFELFADQALRINRLIIRLLLTKEAIPAMKLADDLEVSKDTVMNDLDGLEKKVMKNGGVLRRQARKGFLIEGSERTLRLLMEEIIQKEFTDYDIYRIMALLLQGEETEHYEIYSAKGTDLQAVFDRVVIALRQLLETENLEELNYAELLNSLVRVAIATVRLKNEFTIGSYQLSDPTKIDHRSLAYRLLVQVFDNYQLPLFEDEYRYIYSDLFETVQPKDIMELTEKVIQQVSKTMHYPFYQDPQLLTNLYAHLSLRLSRKQKFVNEYNPFKGDIKRKYPKLFIAISEAVKKVITNESLLINDSFVAYIALHFLVSFEKEEDQRSVRAVYICSTGLGVTSLIKQKINEELSNIEIAAFASVLNAHEIIQRKNPDLVISIFPLKEIEQPFIKVHPLPTEQDLQKIQQLVKKLLGTAHKQKTPKLKLNETAVNKETLEEFSKELMLKAYTIYERLLVLLKEELITEYQEAFLLHVFLMVHRITFDQQYTVEGSQFNQLILRNKELVQQIEAIFAEGNLGINQSEISALFAYVKEKPVNEIGTRSN